MRSEQDFPPPSGAALWAAIGLLIVVVVLVMAGVAVGLSGFAHAVRGWMGHG